MKADVRLGLERRDYDRRVARYDAAMAEHIRERRKADRRAHLRRLEDNWRVNRWLAIFHNRRREDGHTS